MPDAAEQWPITLEAAAQRLHWQRGMKRLALICKEYGVGLKVGRSNAARMLTERDFDALCDAIRGVSSPAARGANYALLSDREVTRRLNRILGKKQKAQGRRGRRDYLKPKVPPP